MLGEQELRDTLRRHGLDARRSLGQNFVIDPSVVERVAELSGVGAGDPVVEIGPGLGSLTLALHATGAHVLAVEKDRSLVPALRDVLERRDAAGVEVLQADALELDWQTVLAGRAAGPWTLVANLPYNVAVPLIMGVLEGAPTIERLVVMVQLEVAQRLVAGPGGRAIGVPSIKVAWYGEARLLMTVPPEVFVPRPRVDSAVISIARRPPPSTTVGSAPVFALVEAAYRQRRKMLRSTLGGVVDASAFERAGILPSARPEELDVAAWTRLAEVLHAPGPPDADPGSGHDGSRR